MMANQRTLGPAFLGSPFIGRRALQSLLLSVFLPAMFCFPFKNHSVLQRKNAVPQVLYQKQGRGRRLTR